MDENKNQPTIPTVENTTPAIAPITPTQVPVSPPTSPSPSPAPAPAPATIEAPAKQRSRWAYLFLVLGILQVLVPIAIFASISSFYGTIQGTIVLLLLLALVLPALAVIAAFNLIGLSIYLYKQRPKGGELALEIISMIISVPILAVGGFVISLFSVGFNPS